tara:strand:+ start:159 stop:455 length:297 start_codon:yes stop_codon:yes gene_type:complete
LESRLKELVYQLVSEIIDEDEELDEVTVTGDVDGYSTPLAFRGDKGKKRNKKISTNSTGYKTVNEELDKKDLVAIKKLIKDVIGDVFRDLWIKRTIWK